MSLLDQRVDGVGGQALYDQIVRDLRDLPLLGDACDVPIYLLRFADDTGVEQYMDATYAKYWTNLFTTSCDHIQKVIDYPLTEHLHTRLWAIKVNADFFFGETLLFRSQTFSVTSANLIPKRGTWEVEMWGVIPEEYLHSQAFTIGTDCHW